MIPIGFECPQGVALFKRIGRIGRCLVGGSVSLQVSSEVSK